MSTLRYQGKITEWRDEQGFGFITQKGDGQRLFLHIKSFSGRKRRPVLNDSVTYTHAVDRAGRVQAAHVEFAGVGKKRVSVRRETALPLYFSLAFAVLIVALSVLGFLHWKVAVFYAVLNVMTWFLYMFDKEAARKSGQRRPERILHLLALIGGWPGALLAQRMFRHKSSKRSFQQTYWTTVALHCAGLIWLLTPYGAAVRDLLNRQIG